MATNETTYESSFVREDIVPALEGVIAPSNIDRQRSGAIVVRGRLLQPAEQAYPTLRARFERLGYTPFLQHHEQGVELIAAPVVIERRPRRIWLNILLFILTLISVMITGAFNQYSQFFPEPSSFNELVGNVIGTPSFWLAGVPFAATLLGILFAHEMGHYIVGRMRKAPASLPYFIPLPPIISLTGTMGAVIVQREPFQDRRTLLEVAIAGPLAGLVVAIPLLFYGLSLSTLSTIPPGALLEGNSILYALAKYAVFGEWLPAGNRDALLHPIAWGAWIGLLVTMLNLLPVGQLDGGHVAYALFGRSADWLAYAALVVFLLLGLTVSSNWLIWVLLIAFMGPRHPAPFNDITRLKPVHVVLGIIGLITFVLLFTPQPLQVIPS